MNPKQLSIVVAKSIEGLPSRTIGDLAGVSHTAVNRAKQKPDIKAKVEAGIAQLINRGLKPAINTLTRFAAVGNTKGIEQSIDQARLSLDASKTILSHISGSGPQTVINQLIYSRDTYADLSPVSISMVNKALGISTNLVDNDVIDLDGGSYGGMQDNDKDK